MPDQTLPPATSASQLVTYAMCARKYFCTYVAEVEPEFRSLSLVLGSAVHSGIAWYFEQRLEGRIPVTAAAEEIVSADVLALTTDANIRWKEQTPEGLELDARRFVRLYLTQYGHLSVKAVEVPFAVPLADPDTGEVLGRELKGYFDLVLDDNRVIELKTSARGWSDDSLARHLQVGAYAFVWNTLHGGPSMLDVHVIVKLKREPRVETYSIERGEPATRWWLQAAAAIEHAIQSGAFPPSPSMLCNECEYGSACLRMTGVVEERPRAAPSPRQQVEHRRLELAL